MLMFSWGVRDGEGRRLANNTDSLFKRDSEKLYETSDQETKYELEILSIMTDIAAALVNYRVDNGLSQRDLADLLGCSQAMISKIERGDYNFTIRKLFDVVRKLKGSISVEIDFSNDASDISSEEHDEVSIWEPAELQDLEGLKRIA